MVMTSKMVWNTRCEEREEENHRLGIFISVMGRDNNDLWVFSEDPHIVFKKVKGR
jgi:hypothetical protein